MSESTAKSVLPLPLKAGGHVRVVAPSGPVDADALDAGISVLSGRFRLEVSVAPNTAERDRYLAGSDAIRITALHDALTDPSVDAVWCARGGYGAIRIAEALHRSDLGARRIPFVGFSDITALHGVLSASGNVTYHGPVVTQLPRLAEDSLAQCEAILAGESSGGSYESPSMCTVREGTGTGPLRGGNLSVLTSLIGTPWATDLEGCIVFIEDVGEPAYRIDRMVRQLFLATNLGRAAGLLVGAFTGIDDQEQEWVTALWKEVAEELDGPVVSGFPIGHSHTNRTLPLGVKATLSTTPPHLQITEPWTVGT